jgi:uncharacterized YccA/Bax inhibitor family protein
VASNPAFNRLEKDAQSGYAGFRSDGQAMSASHATQDAMSAQQLQEMYERQSAGPVQTDRVTMDDVIMKTLGLFAIVLTTGTVGWLVSAANPGIGAMLWIGGMVVTLVLGLVIAFKKTLSVPLILTYAVFEGLFVGAVSEFFNSVEGWEGVVPTAVMATLATFVGMFLAYKTGLIKVTSKFRRIMVMALIGYAIFSLVNLGVALFTDSLFGIGGTGLLGIGISVIGVGLAALTLALDFDAIDYAVRTGAPQKYSWLLAHGLIVTLVWLYIEFLRLLARLRGE